MLNINTIIEMKNVFEKPISILDVAERRHHEFVDMLIDTAQSETRRRRGGTLGRR